jgi:hypothetical protein
MKQRGVPQLEHVSFGMFELFGAIQAGMPPILDGVNMALVSREFLGALAA